MFHKGLWFQNYKQTFVSVWILLVLFIMHLPLQAIFTLETWKETLKRSENGYLPYYYELNSFDVLNIFSQGVFPFFIGVGIIFLAALLIGVERNTRRMDFTFSLPISRRSIYLSKWIYGVLLIVIFHSISFLIAYWIIQQSEFAYVLEMVSINQIFFAPLIGFVILYSFALFIGSFTGEMISQIALTLIFSVFPMGFALLMTYSLDIHYIASFRFPEWIKHFTVAYYVYGHDDSINVIYGLAVTAIFTIIGIVLYEKNKVEHNGEFLIFKQLSPLFLIGITISCALFGGLAVSSFAPWNAVLLRIIAYWIGFFIFLFFSSIIARRLLKMNVTVKNK